MAVGQAFESYADLVPAWKTRCALLRLPWTNDELAEALRLVESNTRVLRPAQRQAPAVSAKDERPFSAAEARQLLGRLNAAMAREAARGRHAAVRLEVATTAAPARPLTVTDVNAFREATGQWEAR